MPIEMNYLVQFGGPLIKRKKPAKWRGGGAFFAEVQVPYAKFWLCKVRYLTGSLALKNQLRRGARQNQKSPACRLRRINT